MTTARRERRLRPPLRRAVPGRAPLRPIAPGGSRRKIIMPQNTVPAKIRTAPTAAAASPPPSPGRAAARRAAASATSTPCPSRSSCFPWMMACCWCAGPTRLKSGSWRCRADHQRRGNWQEAGHARTARRNGHHPRARRPAPLRHPERPRWDPAGLRPRAQSEMLPTCRHSPRPMRPPRLSSCPAPVPWPSPPTQRPQTVGGRKEEWLIVSGGPGRTVCSSRRWGRKRGGCQCGPGCRRGRE